MATTTTAELVQPTAGAREDPTARLPITVVVADDHEQTRRRLRLTLHANEDLDVVGVARDLPTTQRQVIEHAPRVLLLDLGMPGGSTTELIRRLRAQVPKTQIVVVTMEDSPVVAEHAMAAGALGYVLKHHADAELVDAIRCAAQGKAYISPRLRRRAQASPA